MTKARSNATAPNAKGTLVVGNGTDASTTLAVASTAGYVLTVDSAEATGLKWALAGGSFVGVSAYKVSTSQTVSANTFTTVTFDGEFFDSDGFHDNSTNNSRFTVPSGKAGKYIILARTIWNEYNRAKVASYIRKNGSTTIAYSVDQCPTDYWETHQIVCIVDLSVGDYVELAVEQNGGGNRSIHGDNNATAATMFQMAKVG